MEIKNDLKVISQALPTGSINRIAKKCKFSQSYVSKFFSGQFALTESNSKILLEVEKILEEQSIIENNGDKKIKELVKKAK